MKKEKLFNYLTKFSKHTYNPMIKILTMRTLGSSILIVGAMTLGCSNDNKPTKNATGEHLSGVDTGAQSIDEVVILSHDDILSTKTELYQPSYNLYGELAPIAEQQILALDNARVSDIYVSYGDWVKMNQPLIRLRLDSHDQRNLSTNAPVDDKTDSNFKDSDTENLAIKSIKNNEVNLSPNSVTTPANDGDSSGNQATATLQHDQTLMLPDTDNPTDTDTDTDNNTEHHNRSNADNNLEQASPQAQFITLNAPKAGKITNLLVTPNTKVKKDQLLLILADTSQLQLIGELPLMTEAPDSNDASIKTESQLPIGQAVNFTVYDINQPFTGQISHTAPNADGDMLTVHALVNQSEDTIATLDEGMQATMSVHYGQSEVGVRLPRRSIHEADLSELNKKHTRPIVPLHGYVWVIGQDQRLSRKPVKIIEYDHETDQFLVSGISNDSLISLADLPASKEGSLVKVK